MCSLPFRYSFLSSLPVSQAGWRRCILSVCPHANMRVLILLYVCPHTTMCPCTTICVSSYCYVCRHTTMCPTNIQLSSYYYICVLILLFACPHTITTYMSSFYYTCVLILLYMCPHTTIYVFRCERAVTLLPGANRQVVNTRLSLWPRATPMQNYKMHLSKCVNDLHWLISFPKQ